MIVEYFQKYKFLILYWIFLSSTAPFIFFRWPGHPYKILTFICLILMIIGFLVANKIIYDRSLLFILSLQFLYYSINFIIYQDISSFNLIVQLISLFISLTFLINLIGHTLFVRSFIIVLIVMGTGGVLNFVYHLIFGIIPFFRVEYGNDVSYFLGLTTTNVFISLNDLRVIRFAGFFDEPGTFGLFASFGLVLNRLYFKSKVYDIFLMCSGIFTFSLAFFFTSFFYIIFFYFNRKSISYFISLSLVVALSFFILYSSNNLNLNFLYDLTFARLQETYSGLEESNRGFLMEHDLKLFLQNPFFGVGPAKYVAGANVFAIPAKYGIVGSFFFYAVLIWLILIIFNKKVNTGYIRVLFILLLSLFHRPELSSVLTLTIFYLIITSIKNKCLIRQ